MLKVCNRLGCTRLTRSDTGACGHCQTSEAMKARRDQERATRAPDRRSDPISDMFLYGRR